MAMILRSLSERYNFYYCLHLTIRFRRMNVLRVLAQTYFSGALIFLLSTCMWRFWRRIRRGEWSLDAIVENRHNLGFKWGLL